MTELVNLYLGEPTKNTQENDFFERVEFVGAKPTTAPADIPRHYDVKVFVRTKNNGEEYKVEVGSRTINNWINRFKPLIEEELESDDGMDGMYRGKERNAVAVKLMMSLVGSWVNTRKATRVS